jgi:alpha-tubulin suppressor-like RCC1 family protein
MVCGVHHTMALSAGTTKWFGTGYNLDGHLGLGDGTAFSWGGGISKNTLTPLTGDWSQMVCGGYHTMALSAGTTKWFGVGDNIYGQLGLGDNTNKYTPTHRYTLTPLTGNWSQMVCGGDHTMALSAGTTKWFGTGENLDGQLGLGDTTNRNTLTPLTGNWSQMVCGVHHTMALSAGTTKWFGAGRNNYSGQLGLGDFTNRNTLTPLTGNWSQMVCGGYHTMALSAGTTKWFGTGENAYGRLGLGDTTNRNTLTPLTGNWSQMVCGWEYTMALSAGTTKWFGTGLNYQGQLGLGDTTNRNTLTPLTGNWSQMVCGGFHTMAISISSNLFTLSTYKTHQYTQSVGLSSGLFLPVSVNGTFYKIPLFYYGGTTITSVVIS